LKIFGSNKTKAGKGPKQDRKNELRSHMLLSARQLYSLNLANYYS
jgi:hypothetical protein